MHPRIRAIIKPPVELHLVVKLVGEAAPRLKRALHEVLQALNATLRLWVPGLTEEPIDAQLPAERGELHRRSAAGRVKARLAVPNQRLRNAPNDHRQRRMPQSSSGVCLENTTAPAPARE